MCMWKHNEALHCVQHSVPSADALPFSVVLWLFWHHERACVVMLETTCPVKIFAQCICWELFHAITPSVSSMWFLLTGTYMYFLVFLSFCNDFTNWEYWCESAIILCGPQTPPTQFPLIVHYLYMSCDASTKTIYVFWRLCTTLFLYF